MFYVFDMCINQFIINFNYFFGNYIKSQNYKFFNGVLQETTKLAFSKTGV